MGDKSECKNLGLAPILPQIQKIYIISTNDMHTSDEPMSVLISDK